ncbi:MAG TPA: MBL fold metallo-hydrolase [Polyangia bacterium]|nr:MBL fold metallo-hydrolase [Polyangia bacterium]
MRSLRPLFVALLFLSSQAGARRMQETGTFPTPWIHGAKDCHSSEPVFQVHRYASDTYILRQNKCAHFEAPFLYLLFGKRKALLLDTGAEVKGQPPRPLHELVQDLVASWERQSGSGPVSLIVAHTHAHGDHRAGDALFTGQPRTTVVEPTLEGVQRFFGLKRWPEGDATFDLGDRPLTVLPLPGHEPTHIAVYDPRHQLLFTGDTLYPGLLTVRDWPAYRKSVGRLAAFVATHKVTHVLGCHIEMTRRPREMYPLETTYQPEEHVLQLGPRHVEELHRAMEVLGDQPSRDVHDDFIIEWIPPRPAP